MFFDAVLNDRLYPIFNGTAEETLAWVKKNAEEYEKEHDHEARVCIGTTMQTVTATKYLFLHKKAEILKILREGFSIEQDLCDETSDELAAEYTDKIMEL